MFAKICLSRLRKNCIYYSIDINNNNPDIGDNIRAIQIQCSTIVKIKALILFIYLFIYIKLLLSKIN